MKKLLTICALVGGMLFTTAQEKPKDSFVKEGNLIKGTMYHDNGEIRQTGYYNREGKLQGKWESFDDKGNKTAVAQYENGKKVGKWFFWNDDTLNEVDYSNSKITNVSTYKITGERVVSNE